MQLKKTNTITGTTKSGEVMSMEVLPQGVAYQSGLVGVIALRANAQVQVYHGVARILPGPTNRYRSIP
jgi:hypothetical protein